MNLETSDFRTSDFHIINVAGLMMNGRDDGIENAFRQNLQPRSIVTVAPTPARKATEHPEESLARAVSQIDEHIAAIQKTEEGVNTGGANILGIGRSYAGFILLKAVLESRERLSKFSRIFLIEAPLHPDVLVEPPSLPPVSVLKLCFRHYRERPRLAQKAVRDLETFGTGKIVTIENRNDAVVPPESMHIPGRFQTVMLDTHADLEKLYKLDFSCGARIILPENMPLRGNGMAALLPDSYCHHLAWSGEKFQLVGDIVKILASGQKESERDTKAA